MHLFIFLSLSFKLQLIYSSMLVSGVQQRFSVVKDYTSFTLIIKYGLYSLCCTIYLCSLFIFYFFSTHLKKIEVQLIFKFLFCTWSCKFCSCFYMKHTTWGSLAIKTMQNDRSKIRYQDVEDIQKKLNCHQLHRKSTSSWGMGTQRTSRIVFSLWVGVTSGPISAPLHIIALF